MELLLNWLIAPLVTTGVSVAYFFFSKNDQKITERIIVSLHGALIAAIYMGAAIVWRVGSSSQLWGTIHESLYILPLFSIIYSFFKFSGKKRWHILQIVNIFFGWYMLLFGAMMSSGVWL